MAFAAPLLAIATAVSTGVAIHGAEQSRRSQNRSYRDQQKAQAQSKAASLSQQRKSEEEFARVNRKKPNVVGILAEEQRAAAAGSGSTMLTGIGGVDQSKLSIGRTTLLGD